METDESDIEGRVNIAPTALVIAHLRAMTTDIRNSSILSEALNTQKAYEEFGGSNNEAEFALVMEARYLAIEYLLEESGIDQVLEVAAGMSPRALNFISKHPSARYVETDLDNDFVELKRSITQPTPNHAIQKLDATNSKEFQIVQSKFNPTKPVAVISEGLLPYVSRNQVEQIAKNIRTLLLQNGGIWITDIATQKGLMKGVDAYCDESGMLLRRLYDQSGIYPEEMAFRDTNDAEYFFTETGFSIQKTKLDIARPSIKTPSTMGMATSTIEKNLSPALVWTLRM